jgi:methylase of polypeptide subunit release factors
MRPGSAPEPPAERYRRESYAGLELLSDSIDRADEPDFALGLAPAPIILARLTVRRPARSVLDLGTGTGIQALLAARHAERVVGVDVNERALQFAASNAARNGIENVEWRAGSWFEPVRGERFDLIVANPPYVVSPDRVLYRDSGDATGELVLGLLRDSAEHLEEDGFAQILCNWVVRDGSWRAPMDEAVSETGCDAVIFLYGTFGAEAYARMWNQTLERRDARAFDETVARWLAFYGDTGIHELAFGVVVLRRRAGRRNWTRAFRVPAGPTEDAGDHLARLFTGWDAVKEGRDDEVELAPGARLLRRLDLETHEERTTLEIRPNVGFAVPVDEEIAARLSRGERLPDDERRRLLGLGVLLTPDQHSRKIRAA